MWCAVNVNDHKLRALSRQTQVVLLPMLMTLCLSSVGLYVSWVLTSLQRCMLYTDALKVLTHKVLTARWEAMPLCSKHSGVGCEDYPVPHQGLREWINHRKSSESA